MLCHFVFHQLHRQKQWKQYLHHVLQFGFCQSVPELVPAPELVWIPLRHSTRLMLLPILIPTDYVYTFTKHLCMYVCVCVWACVRSPSTVGPVSSWSGPRVSVHTEPTGSSSWQRAWNHRSHLSYVMSCCLSESGAKHTSAVAEWNHSSPWERKVALYDFT